MTTWKFQQFEPQKARGKLFPELWDSLDWIAEEKYDGDRRIAQFCPSGLVRFTGTPSRKTGEPVEKTGNLPHLNKISLQGRVLEGTVLDGEMYPSPSALAHIKGGVSKWVTSIMGSAPSVAIRKQQLSGSLRYIVFDCLFFKGKDIRDLPLRERYSYRDQALRIWTAECDHVGKADAVTGVGKRAFYDQVVGRRGEGVVLKHINHTYGDARLWVKVKNKATADVVIIGFTEAETESKKVSGAVSVTKFVGQVGAIEFGQFKTNDYGIKSPVLTSLGTCSGFDDALRAKFTAHPRKYIGQVIEIEHYGREPTGAFRHPQFKRFREDKRATQCIYDPEET